MSSVSILGIMTGTSCDAADAVCVNFSKKGSFVSEKLVFSFSTKFPKQLRKKILALQTGKENFITMLKTEQEYSAWIAAICIKLLRKYRLSPFKTAIAVHGQTLWHAPTGKNPFSLQILNPNILSSKTGCVVISNFRQTDIALGGQGAPLVPLYYCMRAKSLNLKNRLPFSIHNIGGIANLAIVTNDFNRCLAFDTGPGNTLIDMATDRFTKGKLNYDKNGQIAQKHIDQVDVNKIKNLAMSKYFLKKPPKSTGKEMFNQDFLKKFKSKSGRLIAETTAFTAYTMALSYQKYVFPKFKNLKEIRLAGGGARNLTLVALFKKYLAMLSKRRISILTIESSFAPAQFLESIAFARLGWEALHAKPTSLASVTGAKKNAVGVRITTSENFLKIMNQINRS